MMSSIDANSARFLDGLKDLNTRLTKAERQVASGKKVESAADAPESIAALMSAESQLSRLKQTIANLGRFQTEVDAAEGALQEAVTLFDRVRTLGMTGASGIHTELTRKGIAGEIESIMQRMVGIANTQVDGRFVFAGNSDQTAPYSFDSAVSPPWSSYQGMPATREAMHPTGVTFKISMDAESIFDDPEADVSVMQAMDNLRVALLANDEEAMQAALAPLAEVSAQLNSALTFYGNVQSQMTEAVNTGNKMNVRLKAEISGLEDADVTEAIVELQQLKFTQGAAIEVRAKIPRVSLFDYLG